MVFVEIVKFIGLFIAPIMLIIAIIFMVLAIILIFQEADGTGEKIAGFVLLFMLIILIIVLLACIEKCVLGS